MNNKEEETSLNKESDNDTGFSVGLMFGFLITLICYLLDFPIEFALVGFYVVCMDDLFISIVRKKAGKKPSLLTHIFSVSMAILMGVFLCLAMMTSKYSGDTNLEDISERIEVVNYIVFDAKYNELELDYSDVNKTVDQLIDYGFLHSSILEDLKNDFTFSYKDQGVLITQKPNADYDLINEYCLSEISTKKGCDIENNSIFVDFGTSLLDESLGKPSFNSPEEYIRNVSFFSGYDRQKYVEFWHSLNEEKVE